MPRHIDVNMDFTQKARFVDNDSNTESPVDLTYSIFV